MQNPEYMKLNLSVKKSVVEALDRERQRLSRSAYVGDLLWFTLLATPEELKMIDNYAEVMKQE